MPQIDASFFIGEVEIPNRTSIPVTEKINFFINKYEIEYLDQLLGEELSLEYREGIAEVSPEPRWVKLKQKIVDSTRKISPIANFVWFYFMRNEASMVVSGGVAVTKKENAVMVDPIYKQTYVWNDMAKMSFDVKSFIEKENKGEGSGSDEESQPYSSFVFIPTNEVYQKINSLNL
jgi:hypothetical protein